MSTLGEVNKNPLNIRDFGAAWSGKVGSHRGFVTFATPEHGYKAAFQNMAWLMKKRGVRTVKDLIYRWAPPKDHNNTAGYVSRVVKATGYSPDTPLDLSNPKLAFALAKAMTGVELGKMPYSDETIRKGYSAAFAGGSLPKIVAAALNSKGGDKAVAGTNPLMAAIRAAMGSSASAGGTGASPALSGALAQILKVVGGQMANQDSGPAARLMDIGSAALTAKGTGTPYAKNLAALDAVQTRKQNSLMNTIMQLMQGDRAERGLAQSSKNADRNFGLAVRSADRRDEDAADRKAHRTQMLKLQKERLVGELGRVKGNAINSMLSPYTKAFAEGRMSKEEYQRLFNGINGLKLNDPKVTLPDVQSRLRNYLANSGIGIASPTKTTAMIKNVEYVAKIKGISKTKALEIVNGAKSMSLTAFVARMVGNGMMDEREAISLYRRLQSGAPLAGPPAKKSETTRTKRPSGGATGRPPNDPAGIR